jgi:tRNA nucleotidyltransferase (CCA-adding enzyme)
MDVKKVSEVISIIKKGKYKAYLVGGSSRDLLFARFFDDVDIATNAPLDFIYKNFKVVNEDGKSMGSIKINYKNIIIELTKFRTEKYVEKSTFPKIDKFVDDPLLDANRRDFTINAIYLDLTNNEILDPFDGVKDLFSFTLKFIGDPLTRIKEDPSRIIRGIRLAYKLNIKIDEKTNEAFKENISELDRLSTNRFNKEIEKMIEEIGENRTSSILDEYNIIRRA